MKNTGTFTKILAVTGTVLAWMPVLAPTILAIGSLIRRGRFLFDFLMPAEVFPVVLAAWALLLWAALRSGRRTRLLAGCIILAVVTLVGSQAFAQVTGLADGRIGMESWQFFATMSVFFIYDLSVLATGVTGILLLTDLSRMKQPFPPGPSTSQEA